VKTDFKISVVREQDGSLTCSRSITASAEEELGELKREFPDIELLEFVEPDVDDSKVRVLNGLAMLSGVGQGEFGDAIDKLLQIAFDLGRKHQLRDQ
jgi:hypothetical protein